MHSIRLFCVALCLVVSWSSFAQVERNAELAKLAAEDQSDRSAPPGTIDWKTVSPRDAARRDAVERLLKAGLVRAAADYHAAALIFQHGETAQDIQMAHALATVSAWLDPNDKGAKWLTAASWDRYLMRLGKPQWYGTQYRMNPQTKRFELYTLDADAVTDEDRARLSVPSLKEAREREVVFNRK